jgi:hypothetical protein
VYRFEQVLIDDFVDDRARLIGAWIEEARIIRAGRSAELLCEPLKLSPDALRKFRSQRDALVIRSLGRFWGLFRFLLSAMRFLTQVRADRVLKTRPGLGAVS